MYPFLRSILGLISAMEAAGIETAKGSGSRRRPFRLEPPRTAFRSTWPTFRLEQLGRPGIARVELMPTTAIFSSNRGPGHLHMTIKLPTVSLRRGEQFGVPVRLTNTGGRAVKQVSIESSSQGGSVKLVANPFAYAKVVQPGRSLGGTLNFKAIRVGVDRVALEARSSSNRPSALFAVRIDSAVQRQDVPYLLGAIGATGLAIAGALALRWRRRGLDRTRINSGEL
jgi:hypothetical protein